MERNKINQKINVLISLKVINLMGFKPKETLTKKKFKKTVNLKFILRKLK